MSVNVKKNSKHTFNKITNIVCVVLMLVFFVCQFLPFWTYETEESAGKEAAILGISDEEVEIVEKTISLADYVWITETHDDLFGDWKRMKDFDGNKIAQNDIVVMPFIVTLLVIIGSVFCLLKSTSTWTCLFPFCGGVYAVIAYLTTPIYQTGESWIIHLIAAILMAAAGGVLFVQWVKSIYKWFTVKK